MKIKYIWQKLTRGYSDDELWNLDETIARFALPRLKAFKRGELKYFHDNSVGIWPDDEHTTEDGDMFHERICNLDKMIFALENINDLSYIYGGDVKETERKIDEGTELFGKHFRDLCN